MKKAILLLVGSIIIMYSVHAQQKYTLNGYVRDGNTGEELIGVTVIIKEISNGVVTNPYGFYSLTLAQGDYTIIYSYMGYRNVERTISLTKNETINIDLQEDVQEIEEVVIQGEALDEHVADLNMSVNEISVKQVKELPALFGEPDIIKTIQMLPGVINAGEGTSAFFVRGGSADQNLILIDEAPVYDPSHLFGLFSVFNADVIKDAELYKGGIPSQYGGRLSSILDVRTKDGNNKSFHGNGGIGLLASRLMLEGPIKKDHTSFLLSGRRSYVEPLIKATGEDFSVYFYDVNAKVNIRHSNKDRFFIALYAGRDSFSFGEDFGFNWGNYTGTFRWNHLFSERLFSNTSIIASRFDYGLEFQDPEEGFEWLSNIHEYSLKQDFTFFLNPRNELSFGYHGTYREFHPGKIMPTSDSYLASAELPQEYGLDHALYLGNEQKLTENLSARYGLRVSLFQNIGPYDVKVYEEPVNSYDPEVIDVLEYGEFEPIKNYLNWEPRLSLRYRLDIHSSIKASYNRMAQNTHLISAGTVPLPFNTWSPSSYYLKPQLADQVAAGYFRNFKDNTIEASAEVYYKEMHNVTDFADNAQLFFNDDLATEFRQGESWSYGLELMAQKKEGDFTGFISYTWSKTERKVPGVNQGKTFKANYDRRHSLNLVTTYHLSDRWTFGMNFTYNTGRPITLPSGKYQYDEYLVDQHTERNTYLLEDYHRMDLSANLNPRKNEKRERFKTSWNFSIYNVYNRKNPFTIYSRVAQDEDGNVIGDGTDKELRKIYLFPILPSVTFNVNF